MILNVPVSEAILYLQYVSNLKSFSFVILVNYLIIYFFIEPISLGRTTIKYSPREAGLLAFKINDKVTVYSKEAGRRQDLWGVKVNFNFHFYNFILLIFHCSC